MSTEKSDPAGRDGESRWVLQLLAEFAVSSMCRYLRKKRVGEIVKTELGREGEREREKTRGGGGMKMESTKETKIKIQI